MENIPLAWRRSHAAKFWICPDGHTEPFVAFEDIFQPGPGRAARACGVCHIGMMLASWHFDKTGQLIEKPVHQHPVQEIKYDRAGNPLPKSIIRRIVSPHAVIRRLLRRLPEYEPIDHYRTDKVNGIVTLCVSRKGEPTFYRDSQEVEKRHLVITSGKAVPMAVTIELVGVFGWLQDVKFACKKSKLHLMLVMSRECDILPPVKVVQHRRLYKHTYPNKYLPRVVAMLGKNVADISKVSVFTSRDGKVLEGKELEQAFLKKAVQIAKAKKLKLTQQQLKKAVKESQRLIRQLS